MTSLLQNLRTNVGLPRWRISSTTSEQLPGSAGEATSQSRWYRRTRGTPTVPPPAYNRSPGLPLSRTISSGRTLINPQRSCTVQIEWVRHPALRGGWWAWTYRWLYFLRFDKEWLDHKVPEEFKLLFEESAGLETRDKRKAMETFEQRVGHLNRWIIPDMLCLTRFWMVMLLVVDVCIIAYFIFAMVYTQVQQGVSLLLCLTSGLAELGQQPILQVAEVALILMVFLTGGIINHIRVRRSRFESQSMLTALRRCDDGNSSHFCEACHGTGRRTRQRPIGLCNSGLPETSYARTLRRMAIGRTSRRLSCLCKSSMTTPSHSFNGTCRLAKARFWLATGLVSEQAICSCAVAQADPLLCQSFALS